MATGLQDKLRTRRFVITAEVTPPVSTERAELLAKALPLKGLADAVNITDAAGARPIWLVGEQGLNGCLWSTKSSQSFNLPAAIAIALLYRAIC